MSNGKLLEQLTLLRLEIQNLNETLRWFIAALLVTHCKDDIMICLEKTQDVYNELTDMVLEDD